MLSMSWIHSGLNGRFKPMPKSPSIRRAGFKLRSDSSRGSISAGVGDIERFHAPLGQQGSRGPSIIPVVTLAGQEHNQIFRPRQPQRTAPDRFPPLGG